MDPSSVPVGGSGMVAFEAAVSDFTASVVLVGARGSESLFLDLAETERFWRPLVFSILLVLVVEEVEAVEKGLLVDLALGVLMRVSL